MSIYIVDQTHTNASDNNPGTESLPWLTIQHAANQVAAGDTILVKDGVYFERVRMATAGNALAPITFKNYEGHSPIIDGEKNPTDNKLIDWRGSVSYKSHIIFDGFEVRNAYFWPIWVEGDYTIIRHCKIHHCGHTGIIVIGSQFVKIHHNDIYETGWNGMSLESCNYCDVAFNTSRNNPEHFGVNIFPKTNGEQVMESGNNIRNNILYGNLGGIYTRYQQDNKITGNLIYHCSENGIFLHGGAGGPSEYEARTKIINNTVVDNARSGIYNVSANNLTIKDNIIAYHSVHDDYYELQINRTEGHDIDGNIFYSDDAEQEFVYWNGPKYTLEAFQDETGLCQNCQFALPAFADRDHDNYEIVDQGIGFDKGYKPAVPPINIQVEVCLSSLAQSIKTSDINLSQSKSRRYL